MFLSSVPMSSLTRTDLQRIFNEIDSNKDGFVSLHELNQLLEKLGCQFSLEELESLVSKTSLDLGEFLFFCDSILSRRSGEVEEGDEDDDIQKEKDLVEAFSVFDLDGDGFITSQELEFVLKKLDLWDEKSGKDSRSMIFMYDTNKDGKVDFEEFKKMMLLTMS